MNIDIWIIHSEKKIMVTDIPGVPTSVTGYVSEEAKATAEARGYPSISEIGFPTDCHLTADDWTEALRLASEKAAELGYKIQSEDSLYLPGRDDWERDDWDDDEGWWGPENYDFDPYEGEYEDEPSPDFDPEFYGGDVEDLLEFETEQDDH